MADPKLRKRGVQLGTTHRGNFVPTVKLDASRVTDMRAQTGPRMVMRMRIRSHGGAAARLTASSRQPNSQTFRRITR